MSQSHADSIVWISLTLSHYTSLSSTSSNRSRRLHTVFPQSLIVHVHSYRPLFVFM